MPVWESLRDLDERILDASYLGADIGPPRGRRAGEAWSTLGEERKEVLRTAARRGASVVEPLEALVVADLLEQRLERSVRWHPWLVGITYVLFVAALIVTFVKDTTAALGIATGMFVMLAVVLMEVHRIVVARARNVSVARQAELID